MKRLLYLVALSFIGIIAGCNKAEILEPAEQEDRFSLVSFNPVGEISVSEEPLSKGPSLTDDIYCVQVYQGDSPFAMGYFDNLESMKLYLKQGSSYRIIVSMVKNAKNLLGERYNLSQNSISNSINGDFADIFDFYFVRESGSGNFSANDPYSSEISYKYYFPVDYYHYCFKEELKYYSSTTADTYSKLTSYDSSSYPGPEFRDIEHANLNNQKYPTCTDWFYGEVNDYVPTGDYETLDMDFRRVGFKLKYELSGVTDGEVTVKIYNSTRTFIENTTNTSDYSSDTQFIAFYDAKSAWQYAEDYSEQMTVGVVWKRGIGVTQDLGTKVIQVKRNCLNNVKITLGSDDRGAGVNMSLESDGSMDGITTEIPVQ